MRIKAILFDLDGTLVDSNDFHVEAWLEAFHDAGFDIDPGTIHDQIGKGSDTLVPSLIPRADQATQDKVADAHGAIFKARFLNRVKPFPHARELLVRTHDAGQQVVLASSASEAELDHYLDLLDIRAIVAAATSIDDVESSKPAPDIFATALKKIAPLGPGDVMVVGDTPYDVEAAKKCGIAAVAVRSGKFPDEALRNAGAAALYDDAAALLADYERSPLGQ